MADQAEIMGVEPSTNGPMGSAQPHTPLEWPDAACCSPNYPGGCVCPPMERALRAWKRGDRHVAPMTHEHRLACLKEIGQVEGYRTSDYHGADASILAGGVLDAWADYCRDKGLL